MLVPLDGSKTAESALPYARALAERLDADVELLVVVDLGGISGSVSADEVAKLNDVQASRKPDEYLTKVAKTFPQARARFRVERGTAASIIIDEAAADKDTLIIMASHGRSGIHRWLLGSVAEKVLRGTSNPLLLIRASEKAPAEGQATLRSIVVPLDGSKLGELALAPALELARFLGTEVVLVRAYEFPATAYYRADDFPSGAAAFIPSYAELVEEMSREAREYLDVKVKEISAREPVRVRAEIIEGPAAERIIDLARNAAGSLIAMSTHGRSGLKRWILGSVTEKVARHAESPVLIIRAG
jgi:nucleotide-binding universal stress UspA family protein